MCMYIPMSEIEFYELFGKSESESEFDGFEFFFIYVQLWIKDILKGM